MAFDIIPSKNVWPQPEGTALVLEQNNFEEGTTKFDFDCVIPFTHSNGKGVYLAVQRAPSGAARPFEGCSIQANRAPMGDHQYGFYECDMQLGNPQKGVIQSPFLYQADWRGKWNEVDIECVGPENDRFEVNVHMHNDSTGQVVRKGWTVFPGFQMSATRARYGFRKFQDGCDIFVNGKLVFTVTKAMMGGAWQNTPVHLYYNGWTIDPSNQGQVTWAGGSPHDAALPIRTTMFGWAYDSAKLPISGTTGTGTGGSTGGETGGGEPGGTSVKPGFVANSGGITIADKVGDATKVVVTLDEPDVTGNPVPQRDRWIRIGSTTLTPQGTTFEVAKTSAIQTLAVTWYARATTAGPEVQYNASINIPATGSNTSTDTVPVITGPANITVQSNTDNEVYTIVGMPPASGSPTPTLSFTADIGTVSGNTITVPRTASDQTLTIEFKATNRKGTDLEAVSFPIEASAPPVNSAAPGFVAGSGGIKLEDHGTYVTVLLDEPDVTGNPTPTRDRWVVFMNGESFGETISDEFVGIDHDISKLDAAQTLRVIWFARGTSAGPTVQYSAEIVIPARAVVQTPADNIALTGTFTGTIQDGVVSVTMTGTANETA